MGRGLLGVSRLKIYEGRLKESAAKVTYLFLADFYTSCWVTLPK